MSWELSIVPYINIEAFVVIRSCRPLRHDQGPRTVPLKLGSPNSIESCSASIPIVFYGSMLVTLFRSRYLQLCCEVVDLLQAHFRIFLVQFG